MKVVHCVAFCVALAATSVAVASPTESSKASKDELLTLYLLSVAADRCGFPITAKQADMIDRETKALAERLKLRARETTALYSEADVKFEQQGPKACDRNGNFAKGFKETLRKLTGP
jgi:hypothetical protein